MALWDASKIPTFTFNGEVKHSTLGELKLLLYSRVPQLNFCAFQQAFDLVNNELSKEKTTHMKEIPSDQRFLRVLEKIKTKCRFANEELAYELSERRMQILKNAAYVPSEHRELLARLKNTFRLGIISNFDHAESAHNILVREGVASYFEQIIISEEFGWRKPHEKIFNAACDSFKVPKGDILYIGDSIEDDIVGATLAGLDIAWINRKGVTLPPSIPNPNYEIESIMNLPEIL